MKGVPNFRTYPVKSQAAHIFESLADELGEAQSKIKAYCNRGYLRLAGVQKVRKCDYEKVVSVILSALES